jgi:hypothetical protein
VEGYKLASSLDIMLEMSKSVVGMSVEKLAVGAAAEFNVVSWASFSSLLAERPPHKRTTVTTVTPYLRGWR